MNEKELKALTKQDMFEDYVRGLNFREIAARHGVSLSSVKRYSAAEKWTEKKNALLAEVEGEVLDQKLMESQAINKTLRILHKLASDFELGLFTGQVDLMKINIKTLTDSIDKLVRLKMHVDSGGVQRSEVSVKKQTLDWNKIIETSVKVKKERGDDFDEKTFLKTIIDAEVVDEK